KGTAHAAGAIVVNSLADTPGECATGRHVPCTLREAITTANSRKDADTIAFSVQGTIRLGLSLPVIADTLTINGTAPGNLPVVTVSGSKIFRVFLVQPRRALLHN